MDSASFDALFDEFTHTAFRLETLPGYAVGAEDARLWAFRQGEPRPERSVRTSPWLRRIAMSTAQGKSWSRAHLIRHPLSEYLRYELVGCVESQAVGERIGLVDLADHPELERLGPDFWLFDSDTDHPRGVLMHYDEGGRLIGREHVTATARLAAMATTKRLVEQAAIPLNVYLAAHNA